LNFLTNFSQQTSLAKQNPLAQQQHHPLAPGMDMTFLAQCLESVYDRCPYNYKEDIYLWRFYRMVLDEGQKIVNLKHRFISTIWPTNHTLSLKQSFFENGLQQTDRIWKCHFFFVCVWTENNLKTQRFENGTLIITFSFKTNPKSMVTVAFLNSSGVVRTEIIWHIFRAKSSFSSVDRALDRYLCKGRTLVLAYFLHTPIHSPDIH